jgi:hypothetical protein
MNWPIVEFVVGIAFFFFLMSTLASAVQEAIANAFSLRAKGLESGIVSMLGHDHAEAFFDTAIVLSQRKPAKPGEATNERKKPSYLGASTFADALHEMFGVAGEAFRLDLGRVDDERLRVNLEHLAAKVGNDAATFRHELERWFDATMDRASGWYKRRSHLILFIIGLVLASAANLSAVTVGQRMWTDSTLRSVVNAEAAQVVTPTTVSVVPPTTTPVTPPGPLQRAEDDFRQIHHLGFPAGWGSDNRPNLLAGWLSAIAGWLITAFAVSLGAPFWFDVLSRVARLRSSGPIPPATTTDVAPVTQPPTTPSSGDPTATSGPALVGRMKRTERAAVIVSGTSIGGPSKFASLYKALDVAGPSLADAEMHNSYSSIAILTREQCTRARIVSELVRVAASAQVVDLVLMVHGEPERLALANGAGGTEDVAAVDLASDIADNAALKNKLRLCYSTACYGHSHAEALLGAGFSAVIGAIGVNANSGTELPILLRHWTGHDTIADALRHADDPMFRAIADTISRQTFTDANSEKILLGDGTITIDSKKPTYGSGD